MDNYDLGIRDLRQKISNREILSEIIRVSKLLGGIESLSNPQSFLFHREAAKKGGRAELERYLKALEKKLLTRMGK